jgi:hypothetical protein
MSVQFLNPSVQTTKPRDRRAAPLTQLWEDPGDVASRDVVFGPWGRKHAPDTHAIYALKHLKDHGVSPGMTVTDPSGRKWSVKQGDEGNVEVVQSRILSALGYRQPPVYFLKSFTVQDDKGVHEEPGGRFRPEVEHFEEVGEWSWQQNPFVGTKPYQGLLVILLIFNSSDLKNSNNSVYERGRPDGSSDRWYVVRDIGTALGETARFDPKRNDPDIFAHRRFISGVRSGFVDFSYHGWHQELYRDRITAEDLGWACGLISRLTDAQWHEAFKTAGYQPLVAGRFIAALKSRIEEGRRIGEPARIR